MFSNELIYKAESLVRICQAKKLKITTAESCTGGLLCALITEIAGASQILDMGFITYSNEMKNRVIGVPTETIAENGAVSQQVAEKMAIGALINASADIAASITGIAGPSGGTPEKPVGLVYIAISTPQKTFSESNIFAGSRHHIRMQSITRALELMHTTASSM